MTDLIIGDETFRVQIAGDATRPALMLSNSLGTDLTMWDGQMADLTKHFRVIRYDSRGHGGSVVGDRAGSMAQMGQDVLAILDALEIEKVHWLGLSMGGAVGLWLLVNAPERIDRAVLANTAPRLGAPDGWNARITDVLANGMEANAASTMERWFSPAFTAKAADRTSAIHTMLREVSPQGYAAACAALRDMDLREALRGIGHDVLIITGKDDPVVPDADAAAFVDSISGAKHVALDARHLSNIEAEAAFNAAVVTFLTAKPASRARPPAKKATASAKPAAAAKRGGAGRRSNAARSPLKKVPAKKAPAKKARRAPAKVVTTTTGRRATTKTSAARRAAPKAVPKPAVKKKAATKTTRKAAPARRPTPVTAARGPMKKAARPKKAAAKTPAKKATPKTVAKKLPGARRRTTKKSGRPTGRRKT